jgi:acyl carrier protein
VPADAVEQKVKDFILREFLPGEDPDELQLDTPLLSTGILDSIATLKLVSFLESEFDIGIDPHEADAQNLNTVAQIVSLVSSKI